MLKGIAGALFAAGIGILRAETLPISVAYSNATAETLPFELFTRGEWSPDPDARFVKLHLQLDRPAQISRVELASCEPLAYESRLFADLEDAPWRIAAGAPRAAPAAPDPRALLFAGTLPMQAARTLTFSFERNRGFALCGLKLFDARGQAFEVRTPRIVPGRLITAGYDPRAAREAMNLFDSRLESAWVPPGRADTGLGFAFDTPQTFSRLLIWRARPFRPSRRGEKRAQTLFVEGEAGYRATLTVKDMPGAQEIELPEPYTGKTLLLSAGPAGPDGKPVPLAIGELRFGAPDGWFMPDPLPVLQARIAGFRRQFSGAGLRNTLDTCFVDREKYALRLYSDGSFDLSGLRASQGGDEAPYFAQGNYEVAKRDRAKGLQLLLSGYFYETGCTGGDCAPGSVEAQPIVHEQVWLKPGPNRELDFMPVDASRFGQTHVPLTEDTE